jgi:hypothetical protein
VTENSIRVKKKRRIAENGYYNLGAHEKGVLVDENDP